jgi:hypothetical protein
MSGVLRSKDRTLAEMICYEKGTAESVGHVSAVPPIGGYTYENIKSIYSHPLRFGILSNGAGQFFASG